MQFLHVNSAKGLVTQTDRSRASCFVTHVRCTCMWVKTEPLLPHVRAPKAPEVGDYTCRHAVSSFSLPSASSVHCLFKVKFAEDSEWFFFPFFSKDLFFYFWLWRVFVAVSRLSLVAVSGDFRCGAQPSHCTGFSCCRPRALGYKSSEIVAHRLTCSEACGIFPHQGLNPCPLHCQADS